MKTLGAALCWALLAQDVPFDPAVHEATRTCAFADFRIVPVKVHRLRSSAVDALHCRLTDDDIRRIFGKVNRIWNRAGIALAVDAIVEEEAVVPPDFDAERLADFKATRPALREPGRLHVYYVHQLPVNGVYFGADAILVKDTAALRRVRGGVDEPLPRVTSHEIGHAFGLQHRQDTINLMASGTTGWSLNDDEIDRVRRWALDQDWVWSPEQALEHGQAALLSTLPGESPVKSKALESLPKK